MFLFDLLSDIMFDGKSFKEWFREDTHDDFDAAGLFFVNYIVPWIFAALAGGLVYACGRAISEGEEHKNNHQSVPVDKTVMINPKQFDKKTTINYDYAKKLLASVRKSNFIKTK